MRGTTPNNLPGCAASVLSVGSNWVCSERAERASAECDDDGKCLRKCSESVQNGQSFSEHMRSPAPAPTVRGTTQKISRLSRFSGDQKVVRLGSNWVCGAKHALTLTTLKKSRSDAHDARCTTSPYSCVGSQDRTPRSDAHHARFDALLNASSIKQTAFAQRTRVLGNVGEMGDG